MADACSQEVLVVSRVAQQEHASRINKIRIRTQIDVEITAHATATEHSDPTIMASRHVTGVFQRFPRTFEKLAVLRIHDCCIFG